MPQLSSPTSSKLKQAKTDYLPQMVKSKKVKNQTKKCSNFNYLNIYATGLPAYTVKEDFMTFLKTFGQIKSVKIPYKKVADRKECKGHAKIEVENQSTFDLLISTKDAYYEGSELITFEAFLKGDNLHEKMKEIESRQVSIFGKDATDADRIRVAFEVFGAVEQVSWEQRQSDSKYFGSIVFKCASSVAKSLEAKGLEVQGSAFVSTRPYISQFGKKSNDTSNPLSAEKGDRINSASGSSSQNSGGGLIKNQAPKLFNGQETSRNQQEFAIHGANPTTNQRPQLKQVLRRSLDFKEPGGEQQLAISQMLREIPSYRTHNSRNLCFNESQAESESDEAFDFCCSLSPSIMPVFSLPEVAFFSSGLFTPFQHFQAVDQIYPQGTPDAPHSMVASQSSSPERPGDGKDLPFAPQYISDECAFKLFFQTDHPTGLTPDPDQLDWADSREATQGLRLALETCKSVNQINFTIHQN